MGLCEGNSPVTGKFPSQRASNAENVSIWWRHHANMYLWLNSTRQTLCVSMTYHPMLHHIVFLQGGSNSFHISLSIYVFFAMRPNMISCLQGTVKNLYQCNLWKFADVALFTCITCTATWLVNGTSKIKEKNKDTGLFREDTWPSTLMPWILMGNIYAPVNWGISYSNTGLLLVSRETMCWRNFLALCCVSKLMRCDEYWKIFVKMQFILYYMYAISRRHLTLTW